MFQTCEFANNICSRGIKQGETNCFPVVELSYHPEQNLVEFLFAPATINKETEQKAYDLAVDVIEKLDMVGLLAVEMFLTKDF